MSIVIIGTGFAGLCMGIRLKQAGIDDFVLLERGSAIGGAWRDNDYPGCACDVESHLYSFSFEPNPKWSRMFAPQAEIRAYTEHVAAKYGMLPHVRLNQDVTRMRWDDASKTWAIETASGESYRAQVVISAMGGLSNPAYPAIPGLETFKGEKFHSARWNHGYDLTGKRVAAIGTGASAIQYVPAIQPKVEQLYVYQRTPAWILPKADRAVGKLEQRMYELLPFTQRLMRSALYWKCESRVFGIVKHPKLMARAEAMALRYLESQVRDPLLRARLTPKYAMGCKRVLLSNDFYRAIGQPNVELVTDGIREVRGNTVISADGHEREVDAIIFGTGFTPQEPVKRGMLIGKGGVDLLDAWSGGAEAFKGATMSGFPNLFFLIGPNTGLGHNSILFMIECLAGYVLDAIVQMRAHGWSAIEPRREALRAYNDRLQSKVGNTVWQKGGCSSWYLNEAGRNTVLWPDFTFNFRSEVARFDASDYVIDVGARAARPVAAPQPVAL